MKKYDQPMFQSSSFHCPHCAVYAHQQWYSLSAHNPNYSNTDLKNCDLSICSKCYKYALWVDKKMVYPAFSSAPLPSENMPRDVQEDFNEARSIVNSSPRSAAALLRLALQKLMSHLKVEGKDLNEQIGYLVEEGLPVKIQQSLDAVRVIGNNAVHPGEIDLRDNREIALALFDLLNIIIETMITQPKKVEEVFGKIPESTKEAIKKRDNK
ncbi:DUF4145 domain-containing protein [Candidatus Acetothermia bacterium]|nr:DUF4145 domain-containing protein [Candidatus Acetothermia bacterium]